MGNGIYSFEFKSKCYNNFRMCILIWSGAAGSAATSQSRVAAATRRSAPLHSRGSFAQTLPLIFLLFVTQSWVPNLIITSFIAN